MNNNENITTPDVNRICCVIADGNMEPLARFCPTDAEEAQLRFEADSLQLSYEEYLMKRCSGTVPSFQFVQGLVYCCRIMETLLNAHRESLLEKIHDQVTKETALDIALETTELADALPKLIDSVLLLPNGFFGPEDTDLSHLEFTRKLLSFFGENLYELSKSPVAPFLKA